MLNIVGEPSGWVCGWIADSLARGLGAARYQQPIEGTNIYVPYYFLRQKSPRDVALFTHYDNPQSWNLAAELADVCVAMSNKTAEHLPSKKTVVLQIPPDPQFRKNPIVLGVAGRDYARFGTNRKNVDWLEKIRQIPGVEVKFTNGELAWEDMPGWYSGIDYLLVTSSNEGGPMSVVEAIAAGKPVIAPDVGWAWDYPVIRYEGWEGLEKIVRRLAPRPDEWALFIEKVGSLC